MELIDKKLSSAILNLAVSKSPTQSCIKDQRIKCPRSFHLHWTSNPDCDSIVVPPPNWSARGKIEIGKRSASYKYIYQPKLPNKESLTFSTDQLTIKHWRTLASEYGLGKSSAFAIEAVRRL
jgi:hypothetical protein